VFAHAGRAVVAPAGGEGAGVEAIHLGAAVGAERHV
jgi:hypothetical protein